MKLYEIFIENNQEYGDYDCQHKLIVANSKVEADIRAESWLKETYSSGYAVPSFHTKEIDKVDGFKILVSMRV